MATAEEDRTGLGAAAAVEVAAGETAKLPAFLPSAEFMPPDYEELTPGQEASFDLTNDDVVFYVGRIGARLNRDQEGNTRLNFPGIKLPGRYQTVVVKSPQSPTSEWKGEWGSGEFPQEGILLKSGWNIRISDSSAGLNFSSVWYREFLYKDPPEREIDIELPRGAASDGSMEKPEKLLFLHVDLKLEDGRLALINSSLDGEGERVIVPVETLVRSAGAGTSSGETRGTGVGEQAGVEAGRDSVQKRMAGAGVASTEEPEAGERLVVVDRERGAGAEKAVAPAATAARAEGIPAAEMISPVERQKSWEETALEMGEDNFAAIGFKHTGNEIAAAAAFEFRAEIADGRMTGEMFQAMRSEIYEIAKRYEARLGQPAKQKLAWPEVVKDMGSNEIAKIAFERTGSRIVAATAYRFRQGILKSQDEGAGFKAMREEINQAVRKYRERMGKRKA